MRRINKKEVKKGWKVVLENDGKFFSYCVFPNHNSVEYRVGKWTRPVEGAGPLCVFKTRRAAEYFSRTAPIIKCVYVPSKENRIWFADRPKEVCELNSLPSGKALADAVMLLPRKSVKRRSA